MMHFLGRDARDFDVDDLSKAMNGDKEAMMRCIKRKQELEDKELGIRKFTTGATRGSEEGKLDFEGALSPLALEAMTRFMHIHRTASDGSPRGSDNWQLGIPLVVYIKSAWRHFFDLWRFHRGLSSKEHGLITACALLFNVSGWVHEYIKANPDVSDRVFQELEKEVRERRQAYERTLSLPHTISKCTEQCQTASANPSPPDAGWADNSGGLEVQGVVRTPPSSQSEVPSHMRPRAAPAEAEQYPETHDPRFAGRYVW